MGNGISSVYGKGALYGWKPVWTPDADGKKKKSKPNCRKETPYAKLQRAMLKLKRQKRTLDVTTQQLAALELKLKEKQTRGVNNGQLMQNVRSARARDDSLRQAIARQELLIQKLERRLSNETDDSSHTVNVSKEPIIANASPFGDGRSHEASVASSQEESSSDATFLGKFQVPLPEEKQPAEGLVYPGRDGQDKFRDQILDAYGCCALSGCRDKAALEAAHIIPYVNAKSNVVNNGLCLRADLHRLYDRNLIKIDHTYQVSIDPCIASPEYTTLNATKLILPARRENWPDQILLANRNRFI